MPNHRTRLAAIGLALLLLGSDLPAFQDPAPKQDPVPTAPGVQDPAGRVVPPQPPPQGQEPQKIAEIPIPSDHEGREVIELSVLDALRIGRHGNLNLRAEELVPFASMEGLRIEQAFFEPELFGDARIGRSKQPARNSFQPSSQSEFADGRLGLRQRVVTGGLFELTFAPGRLRQEVNSPFVFPSTLISSELVATVTQPLLRGAWSDYNLGGVYAAEANVERANMRFQTQVQDTLLAIVTAYWNLVASRDNYRVVQQSLELAREQLRITNERIRVRDLAERDRVGDEAEVARRVEDLIRAENVIRQAEDDLRRLLFDDRDGKLWLRNIRPISPIASEFVPPDSDWRNGANIALEHRPDIAALRSDVRLAEIEAQQAARDVLPQLDLIGSYSSDGLDQNSFAAAWQDTVNLTFPDWSVALQFSVPLGNNAARGARDRAELELERARRTLYAAEVDVAKEVRDALRNLKTLAESIRAAGESERLADTTLDTARERLRVGRGTQFEVQQRNQELLEARQRLLRNQLDFRIAEATLLHAQGVLSVESAEAKAKAR